MRKGRRTAGALTLAEMMLALAIMSILSVALADLVVAACDVNVFAQGESTALWDGDFAWHRITANGLAAVPAAAGGMTPLVTADANGQSRLKFVVPDITNGTTRVVQYYCSGASAPFTLVEDDPRYNVAGAPNAIAYNVKSFSATIDSSTTMKIWSDLKVVPKNGWVVRRHFCVNSRDF